jgi:hypothetical protein
MREDTLSADIQLSGEIVESSAMANDTVPMSRHLTTRSHYAAALSGIVPLLTLSVLFSASAPGTVRLAALLSQDSSVVFSRQRPTRRRVTLAQARQFALQALHIAEAARVRFAEIEGAYFTDLYEWSGR